MEFVVHQGFNTGKDGLLSLRAFDRFHREVPVGAQVLRDYLSAADLAESSQEVADVVHLVQYKEWDSGAYAPVVSNGLPFRIGGWTGGDDHPSIVYTAEFQDSLPHLALPFAALQQVGEVWSTLSLPGRYGVLSNPETPAEILQLVAEAGSEEDLRLVADHPRTATVTLQQLAELPDSAVRLAIVAHASTSPTTLAHLAASPEADAFLES